MGRWFRSMGRSLRGQLILLTCLFAMGLTIYKLREGVSPGTNQAYFVLPTAGATPVYSSNQRQEHIYKEKHQEHIYKEKHREHIYKEKHEPPGKDSPGSEMVARNLEKIPEGELHDKWIVVTTINPPTSDIMALAKVPGWKLVVVGDTKTPTDWAHPGVVYLDPETQKKLPYLTLPLIPWKNYGRKTIGYLYAIHHGAKMIYDTDDDNHPTDNLAGFDLEKELDVIMIDTDNSTYNPYVHFGQLTIWPRGYPLERVSSHTPFKYKLCTIKTPVVQQGVVNGDPDMGALFRLTRKNPDHIVDLTFDPAAPPVVLPRKTMSPYNSQNTLTQYNALWSLYMPKTVTLRVTDIWRGYWAQRLMWLLGERLAFYGPNAYQLRSAHSYLKDASEEVDLYFKAGNLVKFLNEWTCKHSVFFDCVLQLSQDMTDSEHVFWKQEEVTAITAWLNDLKSFGYQQPTIKETMEECLHGGEPIKLTFHPREQRTHMYHLTSTIIVPGADPRTPLGKRINPVCGHPKLAYDVYPGLANSLLLVVGVHSDASIIPHLDGLYRPWFSSILYCISNTARNVHEGMLNDVFATYVQMESISGARCVNVALRMGYNVTGTVFTPDNVLLNPASLQKLNRDHGWYTRDVKDNGVCRDKDECVQFNKDGIKEIRSFVASWETSNPKLKDRPMVKCFKQAVGELKPGKFIRDLPFHIPTKFQKYFRYALKPIVSKAAPFKLQYIVGVLASCIQNGQPMARGPMTDFKNANMAMPFGITQAIAQNDKNAVSEYCNAYNLIN